MKACICNTPNREVPIFVPPFGSLAIIQSLQRIGLEVEFYNIDYFRPKHDDIASYFSENHFDVVGISAVVSTAYSFTKYISNVIRSESPETVIVVGGNLAASAEILLRKCKVDFCVVGDGELTIQELVRTLDGKRWDYKRLKAISGICFLEKNSEFHFTGYRTPLPGHELDWPDYSILEADGSLQHYLQDNPLWLHGYKLEIPGGMSDKRNAIIPVAKGCPNRCTFCHRWEKGYRIRPVDQIKEHIKFLKDQYNIGFVELFDEAFGSNPKHAREIATFLGEMGMIWRANAIRCRAVNQEILMHWKANGCRMVSYGIESGSQTMLDVMEKKSTVPENKNALKWTYEAGIVTIVQLVLGMPGESDFTIKETIDFLKQCMPYYSSAFRDRPRLVQSINYAQALPGTPLYEYYRKHGFIGKTLDDEEKYLERVSDVNASNPKHFINATREPLLRVRLWGHKISGEALAYYFQEIHGTTFSFSQIVWEFFLRALRPLVGKAWSKSSEIKTPLENAIIRSLGAKCKSQDKSSNNNISFKKILFLNGISRRLFYPVLGLGVALKAGGYSPFRVFSILAEYLGWRVSRPFRHHPALPQKSLRKIVNIRLPLSDAEGSEAMIPLRNGR